MLTRKKLAIIFFSIAIILFLISATLYFFKDKKEKRPNVVLIVIDTLRNDRMSYNGYQRNLTPNLAKLAKDSIVYKNAISQASWTIPAIAAIMSSQYPSIMGYTSGEPYVLDPKILTLAEIFHESNYKTKAIVSHIYASSRLGFDQGFDSFDEDNLTLATGDKDITSPSVSGKAIEYLEGHKDETFFLFLHYFDPHYNFTLHKDYNYDPNYKGHVKSGMGIADLIEMAPKLNSRDLSYLNALYDSEIAFTDEHIGKVINKLKELNLYDDTLIVFTADHGEEFTERGDHWIGHSKTLYQELIHVPLTIKVPGNKHKTQINEFVATIDIMPTMIDYLSLNKPEDYKLEGEILDLRNGGRAKSNRVIFSETHRKARLQSIIYKGRKLILNLVNGKKQLFNVQNDPLELSNLALQGMDFSVLGKLLAEFNKHILSKHRYKGLPPKFSREQIQALKSLGYM